MQILFEVLGVLFQSMWAIIKMFGTMIWENLPAILEIKKVMGYFTPAGMIALYLGVPTIVITAAVWLIKKAVRS